MDIKSGYRHFPVAPSMRDGLIFRWEGKYYQCVALPFGWGRYARLFMQFMAPCGVCVSLTLAMPRVRFYTRSLYWDMSRKRNTDSRAIARLSHQSIRDLRKWKTLSAQELSGRLMVLWSQRLRCTPTRRISDTVEHKTYITWKPVSTNSIKVKASGSGMTEGKVSVIESSKKSGCFYQGEWEVCSPSYDARTCVADRKTGCRVRH